MPSLRAIHALIFCLAALGIISSNSLFAQSETNTSPAKTYDALISEGNQFLKDGKPKEGYQDALAAAAQDPKRFEAYALAAFILQREGSYAKAKEILDEAISRAPAEKRDALLNFQTKLLADMGNVPPTTAVPVKEPTTSLSPEARRKYDVLMLMVEDADKANNQKGRVKAMAEFMDKSTTFLQTNPGVKDLWVIRAAASMELDDASAGWEAGRKLMALGEENSSDPKIRKLLAELDRRGWLGDQPPQLPTPPTGQRPFTNSLGMVFVPIDGVAGMFSIWDTRLGDFKRFVHDTGYDATGEMISFEADGAGSHGRTWMSPGFPQNDEHPVVGVNFDDAKAFCDWLTERERRSGILGTEQSYRVPTFTEWKKAWGRTIPINTVQGPDGSQQIRQVYPWGFDWPPPAGIGNLPGIEARDSDWPSNVPIIQGYLDGYSRTSPVGKFKPNVYGLYDMIGNVQVIATDRDEFVCIGYSWRNPLTPSDYYCGISMQPFRRNDSFGFRCVLALPFVVHKEPPTETQTPGNAEPLLTAANSGDANAQAQLGEKYLLGEGVAKDYDLALLWYRKAAEQNNPKGQLGMAALYFNGNGVVRDYVEAFQWFHKAADLGDTKGLSALGMCYKNGWGVEKDLIGAFSWYLKAAQNGDADAEENVGSMYMDGKGVTQDYVEARKWLQKSADQGNGSAESGLGMMCFFGQGVPADRAEALKWFLKSADHGYALGQYSAGCMYRDGDGTSVDTERAIQLLRKAAQQGLSQAREALDELHVTSAPSP